MNMFLMLNLLMHCKKRTVLKSLSQHLYRPLYLFEYRPVETNNSKIDTGVKASTSKGKTKEIYVSFSDSDTNLSYCDEEIECDPIPPVKTGKKCYKSHCFRCGKDTHIVKNCPELVRKDVKNFSFSNRLNRFVNNHFPVSFSLFKPKSHKAWVSVNN